MQFARFLNGGTTGLAGDGNELFRGKFFGFHSAIMQEFAVQGCSILLNVQRLAIRQPPTSFSSLNSHSEKMSVMAAAVPTRKNYDQLFQSSEKRLVRILLLVAPFRQGERAKHCNSKNKPETLAEMIGTTRSRVSL